MSDIALHRSHTLGLARAREVAAQWAEDAEAKFGMDCTIEEGDDEDLVHFTRSGVRGSLRVRGDSFALEARLGLLLGAFRQSIESEIEKHLDRLLAEDAARPAAKRRAGAAARPPAAAKAAPKPAGPARSPRRKG